MEEILSSIRKMISDDKPGPSPMPDVMGRTPFGQGAGKPASDDLVALVRNESGGRTARETPDGSGFNSLSDALKVATALSDQRKSLQQEIASVIDKGPRNNLEALTELSAGKADSIRSFGESRSTSAAKATAPLQETFDLGSVSPASGAGAPSDLLSFDFGTMVPLRDGGHSGAVKSEGKRDGAAPSSETNADASLFVPEPKTGSFAVKAEPTVTKPEASPSVDKTDAVAMRPEPAGEARVLPLRTGLNGVGAHGLNGSSVNVSPFPRPASYAAKVVEPEPPAEPIEKVEVAAPEVVAAEPEPATLHPVAEASIKRHELGAHGEALLDAVVDMVQQQPNALSVFASGASFIGGVGGKKPSENLPAIAEPPVSPLVAEPGGGKMDRAAAELLRPMLRQWLSENMERILEDALRSELTSQLPGGKGPEKT
jgi:cell pole-organizing protein PopZ